MEETISLKELFDTLKKRFALIISITLIAMIVTGVVSYFIITPEYKSSTQILVNQKKDESAGVINSGEVQANVQMISTYSVIIKSAAILNSVKEDLNLNMSVAKLNDKITVENAQNSQVMTVSVTDPNPKLALQIANKTAEVFEKEIKNIMTIDNVKVLPLAEDQENQAPSSPNPLLNIAIAAVLGLMIGVGIAFLLEYLDNTVKTEQDIEKLLGLPVLGAITTIDEGHEAKLRGAQKGRSRGDLLGSK